MIFSIGGSERDIKFNWNTISFCSRLYKVPYNELIAMIAYDPLGLIRDMVYSSLSTYPDNLPENFTKELVGEWLADVSKDDLADIQNEIIVCFGLSEKDNKEEKKKN